MIEITSYAHASQLNSEKLYAAEESTLVWKRASLVRRPMRMAPLFRIMDEVSSGVEKVALIWRMEVLLLSLW